MNQVRAIVSDETLTYSQQVFTLAREAEHSAAVLRFPALTRRRLADGTIDDLGEGNAPYRPRYVLPDYARFLRRGSAFLGLRPPTSLPEAISHLLIIYRHVPSITSFPVYLGELDTLLEPFVRRARPAEADRLIRLFLVQLDRTLTDSFVHANLGPRPTRAGRLILRAERDLRHAVPNLSLLYDRTTTDEYALEAIRTGLATGQPYFFNHHQVARDFPGGYGVVSCYNTLPRRGGAYTLGRLNLAALGRRTPDVDRFFDRALPAAVAALAGLLRERVRFLVEESAFFRSSFLVREGLVAPERFTAMFGVVGLAEAVNRLRRARRPADRFGRNPEALALGVRIVAAIRRELARHRDPCCKYSGGRYLLHAQSGIVGDRGITPGCRVPIGDEPELTERIRIAAAFHPLFPAGISDPLVFETTARRNPRFLLDIIKGALGSGMKCFAFSCADNDLVRITGFLVKRTAARRLAGGAAELHDTVALGLDAFRHQGILNRRRY